MSDYARIGYINYIDPTTSSITSASSQVTGFEPEGVLNSLTYERWKPATGVAGLIINTGVSTAANYIAIGSHTLKGLSLTVSISPDNSSWTPIANGVIIDTNKALFYTFGSQSARYIKISTFGFTPYTIGVVYAGVYTEMPVDLVDAHNIGTLSRVTEYKTNTSQNGQWLGRSITKQGLKAQFNWKYIPISDYKTTIDPFLKDARENPFFIQWRPTGAPDEVMYCWMKQDPTPRLMNNGNEHVEFSLSVEGIE